MNRLARPGAAALAILAMTGCGGGNAQAGDPGVPAPVATVASAAPSAAPSVAPSAASSALPRSPSAAGEPTKPKPAGHPCPTAALLPNLIFRGEHDGLVNSMLVLTNRGAATCTVQGSVKLTAVNNSDKSVSGPSVARNFPNAGPPITVKIGDPVFSGVQWKTGPGCAQGYGVSYTAPGQVGEVVAGTTGFGGKAAIIERFRVCGPITVGTLQPTSAGVTFP